MKRRILLISAAVLLVAVLVFGQNVANYMEQGGSVWNIGSGGTLKVLSGGTLQIDSGATFTGAAAPSYTAGLTVTGGTVSLNADAAANTTNIATGAAAKTVSIGSTNTTSALNLLAGSGNLDVTAASSTFSGNVALGTATATSGLIVGGGANGTPLTTATGDKSYGLFYTQSTASTGTQRGIYWKHFLGDTTPSGEAARFYTVVNAIGATDAHGVHASLAYGAGMTCTGESAALRSTLEVPDAVLGGTNGSLYTELWAGGTTSDMSNGQFQRYVFGGNATGIGVLDDSTALFSIEGNSIGSGNMVFASGKADGTHLIRIRINGVAYYLMAVNAP
jgi:hypothetical protein